MDDNYRRDALWKLAYETYYDVYYDELLSDALSSKWDTADQFARVLTAVATLGSAIFGSVVWSRPEFQAKWTWFAAFAAFCAVLHLALGVSYRIAAHADCRSRLQRLRIDLETFRGRMSVNHEFRVDSMEAEFLRFRERYGNDCLKNRDILETKKLRNRLQAELNSKLERQ